MEDGKEQETIAVGRVEPELSNASPPVRRARSEVAKRSGLDLAVTTLAPRYEAATELKALH